MKKTAVEWLFEQYVNQCLITLEDVQKAKEIEREQIINAAQWMPEPFEKLEFIPELANQYYTETFNQ